MTSGTAVAAAFNDDDANATSVWHRKPAAIVYVATKTVCPVIVPALRLLVQPQAHLAVSVPLKIMLQRSAATTAMAAAAAGGPNNKKPNNPQLPILSTCIGFLSFFLSK